MRIWPSRMIRDAFKFEFPTNTVWDLQRIKIEKRMQHKFGISSCEGSLLNEGDEQVVLLGDGDVNRTSDSEIRSYVILDFCRGILWLLSCCYCYSCCGGGIDECD